MHLLDDGQILRITQLRSEDGGVYICDAENSLQRISASTDLRVRDPSKHFFFKIYIFFSYSVILNSTTILFSTYVKFNNLYWSIC
jgi:hypothetical protein